MSHVTRPVPTTTDAGIPVPSDEYSMTVGAQGPIVLHDHYLMEQMATFNREMIPDRQLQQGRDDADGCRLRPGLCAEQLRRPRSRPRALPSRRDVVGEFVHAGTLARDVMDDAARDRLVSNAAGHLSDGVSDDVLERAFEYWRSVDQAIGDRIADAVER